MKLCTDGVIMPWCKRALRWRRIRHAYGLGIWIPDREQFPNRLILGIGIIVTLEWIRMR